MLTKKPENRISAKEALQHPWFLKKDPEKPKERAAGDVQNASVNLLC